MKEDILTKSQGDFPLEQIYSDISFLNEKNNNDDRQIWFENESEGQLLLDVYQNEKYIYVVSTVAGVEASDLSISIDNDILTIRGVRKENAEAIEKDYFYQECYWGKFSRSIILPLDVKADKATASIKAGVLTIKLPKTLRKRNFSVTISDES